MSTFLRQMKPTFAVPANTPVPRNEEHPASAERFFCPECGRYTNGPDDLCSGGKARVSFLDAKHSPNVRPEREVLPSKPAEKLGTGESA